MATNFPLSASIGQVFEGYVFNGTAWEIQGQEWDPIYYGPTAPDYAEPGFLWIDSDSDATISLQYAEIVTASASQTLTNKVISGSSNYLYDIPQSAITGLQQTLDSLNPFPSQTGQEGKYLTTDGINPSWQVIDVTGPISVHNNQTTNVHGIADTSLLATKSYADNSASVAINNLLNSSANFTSDLSTDANLTVDGNLVVSGSVTFGTVSNTELKYLDGVTSSIQTQIDSKENKLYTIEAEKTTAYTVQAGDEAKLTRLNGTFTVTVPADSTYNFPIGTEISILNTGTGVVTTAGAVGVTLNGTPGLKLRAQYSAASLVKLSANNWVILGDLTA